MLRKKTVQASGQIGASAAAGDVDTGAKCPREAATVLAASKTPTDACLLSVASTLAERSLAPAEEEHGENSQDVSTRGENTAVIAARARSHFSIGTGPRATARIIRTTAGTGPVNGAAACACESL